jgi:uridine kinase
MIGDRLLITNKSYSNAKQIFDTLKNESIILIYGGSGTQKSETADCLQELLFKQKKQSLVLSLDDFYGTHPTIRNFNRKKLGIESVGISEIDWESLQRICQDFKNKKPIHFQRTHKYADTVEHIVLETEDIDYLIIEGLYSGYLKKYNQGDIAFYLEGNPKDTFKFRKKRGKEQEDDNFRKQIVQREYNIVYQLQKYADKIIEFGE